MYGQASTSLPSAAPEAAVNVSSAANLSKVCEMSLEDYLKHVKSLCDGSGKVISSFTSLNTEQFRVGKLKQVDLPIKLYPIYYQLGNIAQLFSTLM